MLRKILIVLVLVVAVFAVVVAMQPSALTISRSTTIAAAPAEVFLQVNEFKNWSADTLLGFAPAGPGTTVTWTMKGRNDNFIAKAACLVMGGPDRMIGPDFEKGLAQMKAVIEKSAAQAKEKS